MQKLIFVFLLLWSILSVGFSQNFTLEVPLTLKRTTISVYTQSIDLEEYNFTDFVAVSIKIEGIGVNSQSVRIRLKTSDTVMVLRHFHEEITVDKFVSELIYLSGENLSNIGFEFDFDNNINIRDIEGEIRIFSPGEIKQNSRIKKKTAGRDYSDCDCKLPDYISRTVWGSGFNLTENIYIPPATYTDVTHLIIHHSAGTNISSNWSGIVASIFDYHVNTNGWQDIGYNWLIDPDGTIYEGRGGGNNVRGAHMCGHNDHTMGICLLGTYTSVQPDTSTINSLVQLLAWKCCENKIDPAGSSAIPSYYNYMKNISGHRDGCAPSYTECPGNTLYANLDSIRLLTNRYINTTCSPTSNLDISGNAEFLSIYPNPANDFIKIYSDNPDDSQLTNVEILDLNAHKLIEFKRININYEFNINIGFLQKGVYILKLKNDRNINFSKFIKI